MYIMTYYLYVLPIAFFRFVKVMDYLQNTSNPNPVSNVVTQLLPMAAPLPPVSEARHSSQAATNQISTESQDISQLSSLQQIRSSSAPADFMLTSTCAGTTSFMGTFASTPSFQASLEPPRQQFPVFNDGGRPRHHTTTNVLSLEPMETPQETSGFLGDEIQQANNPFDKSSKF